MDSKNIKTIVVFVIITILALIIATIFFVRNSSNNIDDNSSEIKNANSNLEVGKKYETKSGLMYEVLSFGSGSKPTVYDSVSVHYVGMLTNGQVFDSSYNRGQPASFALNGVISGWTEGLQLMQVGSKFRFEIPSNLAYGQYGVEGVIPPNSDLIFEIELLEIIEPLGGIKG